MPEPDATEPQDPDSPTEESRAAPPPTARTEPGLAGNGARARALPPRLAVSLAAFVVALACAAWFGWSWHSASAAPVAGAQQRDTALADGEQAVQNFNTLDYRHVDQGLQLWLQSSAGALHSQVQRSRASFAQQVEQARTITTARVLDGALTALNTRTGTASIVVALQITVTPPKGTPVTKRSRLLGQLSRTAGGWRLTQIGQVPVSGTGSGG